MRIAEAANLGELLLLALLLLVPLAALLLPKSRFMQGRAKETAPADARTLRGISVSSESADFVRNGKSKEQSVSAETSQSSGSVIDAPFEPGILLDPLEEILHRKVRQEVTESVEGSLSHEAIVSLESSHAEEKSQELNEENESESEAFDGPERVLLCWGKMPRKRPRASTGFVDFSATAERKLMPYSMLLEGADESLESLGTKRIVSVACSTSHVLLVSEDGDVFEHGVDEVRLMHSFVCHRALHNVKIEHVVCGPNHSVAISTAPAQDVYTWGKGKHGELGHGLDCLFEPYPRRVTALLAEPIVGAACGSRHSLALTAAGQVYSWGSGREGQLGQRDAQLFDGQYMSGKPRIIGSFPSWKKSPNMGPHKSRRIVSVACGDAHSMVLDANGNVFCFGSSRRGQCGGSNTNFAPFWTPTHVDVFKGNNSAQGDRVVVIACGKFFCAVITSFGRMYTWGYNARSELGRETPFPRDPRPREVIVLDPITKCKVCFKAVSCGSSHGVAVLNGGRIFIWGRDTFVDFANSESLVPLETLREFLREKKKISDLHQRVFCGDSYTLYFVETENLERNIFSKVRRGIQEVTKLIESELYGDARQRVWMDRILPRWKEKRFGRTIKQAYLEGIPSYLRSLVWPKAIGNQLRINHLVYEAFKERADFCMAKKGESSQKHENVNSNLIEADLPRTFPRLHFFAPKGPLEARLRNVLRIFAYFRPDIGYLQGMSYLAALLCLNVDSEFTAFQCFANVIMKGHLFAFFRLDRIAINRYYDVLSRALLEYGPSAPLVRHFASIGVQPHLYVFNWWQTLFLKVLPLELASRIFDCFIFEGTSFIVRSSIAILQRFKEVLLESSFESCLQILTVSNGYESLWAETIVKPGNLMTTIEKIVLSQPVKEAIAQLEEETM